MPVAPDVVLGSGLVMLGRRGVKISSHTFICEGVTIEDEVFVGHGVMFINDRYPRATADGGCRPRPTGPVEPTLVSPRRLDRQRRRAAVRRHHRRRRPGRRRRRGDARRARGRSTVAGVPAACCWRDEGGLRTEHDRIGVIGYGYWGPNLVRNFAECRGAACRMVCDQRASGCRVRRGAIPAQGSRPTPLDDLCDPSVDAVVIATPVNTTSSWRCGAAAGKHVLVEKPMTSSSDRRRG